MGYFNTIKDYLTGVALNEYPNKTLFRKCGWSATVGTTKSDLWGIGTASEYVFPTAAMQMKILAGNAQNAGVASYTGTATGGSTTTLVDSGKNFTTPTAVVAGDIIIFQLSTSKICSGVVTSVAATTLTCSGGFTGGANPNGLAYSVIDKSAGGTGVQVVELHYLNASYQEKETYIVLNGANPVSTVPTDILRVNNFHSSVSGQTAVGGTAAANVVLADQATGAIRYAIITTGWDQSQQAIFTFPAISLSGTTLTKAVITQWQFGCAKASGTPVVTARLRATSHNEDYYTGVFLIQDILTAMNNNIEVPMPIHVVVQPKTDLKITAVSDAASTICSGGFAGWYE